MERREAPRRKLIKKSFAEVHGAKGGDPHTIIKKTFVFPRKTEKEKNDILKTNLSKIQADCREMVKVDKDNKQTIESHKKTIEKLNEENQSLQSSVSIKELKIKDSQKIINDFQENKRSFVEELKSKSKEIDSFKQKLKTLEEEKYIISRNLDKLTEDNKHLELYKREIEEKTFEINNLHITIEENHQEITSLNNGLHNLQVVHEETQVMKSDFIDIFFDFLAKK